MMSSWIASCLAEVEQQLLSNGQGSLAGAIGRLAGSGVVSSVQLYLHEEAERIAADILQADCLNELLEQLKLAARMVDFDHCTVRLTRETGKARYETKVVTTYSAAWAAEYVRSGFSTVDPVVERCRAGVGEFFWDELRESDPITRIFLAAASAHGVGRGGFTVTRANGFGDLVSVSFASGADPTDFREGIEEWRSDIEDLAETIIEVFTDLSGESLCDGTNLSNDQIRVLYLLAMGREIDEIRRQEFLYGSFENVERGILRNLNARNLTQAVSIATEIGIFDDPPFLEEEVFHEESGRGKASAGRGTDQRCRILAFAEPKARFTPKDEG